MAEFFDKVKGSIEKGVTVVGVRSKEMLDAARLNSQLGTLADQKKDALQELGSLVYAAYQHEGGTSGDAAAKCAEIAEIDAQIKAKEEEIKQVHHEAKKTLGIPMCASCGADLDEDDKFCRKCGAKVEG